MEFRLLGPLEVVHTGVRVEVAAPKQRALLALLLINAGSVVPADHIIDWLWGPEPTPRARKNLQFHVWKLRDALGPDIGKDVIRTEGPGYRLELDGHTLDLKEFERLAATAERELNIRVEHALRLLQGALALWRGPALVDFRYEDFAQPTIRRFEGLRRTVLEDRIEAELRLGRHRELIGELESLVAQFPTSERLCAQLMRALYRSGRQQEALAEYRRLSAELAEIGLEPSEELRELEGRILTHDATLRTSSATDPGERAALPSPRTSLVGRADAVDDVLGLSMKNRLVTLTGVAGCGKTRLAIATAGARVQMTGDEVVFVDLQAVSDGPQVITASATALGVTEQPGDDLSASIEEALTGKPWLVVFDNCEHVIESASELIDRLLASSADTTVLATSREPLGLEGEVTWRVPSLPAPGQEATTVIDVNASDAVQLFVERATAARSDFVLTDENAPVVAEICRRVDGIPLGLELAASALEALSPATVAAELVHRMGALTTGTRMAPHRQRTMDAAIRWSYDLASERAQTVLRRLSVFSGGFTMDAAQSIAVGDDLSADEVFDAVLELVHISLAATDPSADVVRYRLLFAVAQFAGQQLRESREEPAISAAHAAYYSALAERLEPGLETARDRQARAEAALEMPNLRTAIDNSLAAGDAHTAARIALALTWFWHAAGYFSDALAVTEATLESLPAGNSRLAARLLFSVGLFADILGRFDQSGASITEALAMSRQLGDRVLEARALTGLGVVARDHGDLREARRWLMQARELHRTIGTHYNHARTLRFLGEVEWLLGDAQLAAATLDEAEAQFESLGDEVGPAWTGLTRARLARGLADLDAADAEAQRSLTLFQNAGEERGAAWAYFVAGVTDVQRGDIALASHRFGEATRRFTKLGDRRGQRWVSTFEAWAESDKGNHAQAVDELTRCLTQFSDVGDRIGAGVGHWRRGEAHQRMGNMDRACADLIWALDAFSAAAYEWGVAAVVTSMARLCVATDREEVGQQLHAAAIDLVADLGRRAGRELRRPEFPSPAEMSSV